MQHFFCVMIYMQYQEWTDGVCLQLNGHNYFIFSYTKYIYSGIQTKR